MGTVTSRPPSPAPGAEHSSTSDSAWRIPMEQGSRPRREPTAPVNPSLFPEGGGPRSASNPRAASSPRRPRTAAHRGWLPHRRPRRPSGCLAWWQSRGRARMAAPPRPRPSARLLRSLALSSSLLHGGRSCSARPPGAHTLAHGHTLTPARAPSQRRRCSPHPVCRRREPPAGFWRGSAEGRKKRGGGAGRVCLAAPSH